MSQKTTKVFDFGPRVTTILMAIVFLVMLAWFPSTVEFLFSRLADYAVKFVSWFTSLIGWGMSENDSRCLLQVICVLCIIGVADRFGIRSTSRGPLSKKES